MSGHDPDRVPVHGGYSEPNPALDLLSDLARMFDPAESRLAALLEMAFLHLAQSRQCAELAEREARRVEREQGQ